MRWYLEVIPVTCVFLLCDADHKNVKMSEKRSTSQLPKTSSSSSRRVDQPNQELPSTSGIKAEFNIKITITPDENRSLQSLDENMLKQKAEADDEGSFVTVPSFTKEIATSMEPAVIQIATKRHQSVAAVPMVMENVPPPPYYSAQSGPENNNRTSGPQSGPAGGDPPPYTPYTAQRINSFNNVKMRNQYVLKVFLILAVQLVLTIGFISFIIFEIITVGVYLFLVCCPQVRRSTPLNFVFLGFLTCGAAYTSAYVSCLFDTYTVLVALGSTAGICCLVTLLAIQKKVDVTRWEVYLGIASIIIIFYGIIIVVFIYYLKLHILFVIYAGVSCLLFSMYLLYDMQKILGGRRIQLLPNEYILGAITLYTDIVVIFLNLFCVIGHGRFY
ncbi:unnamed protein product [Acanthoscelides obtectus]|uniref:Uncharacterized protein n=2 Tax=Acanthoscelides obtectus TaxID=200917 RepID=A0A9P0LCZ0_ACAOB|nr:unnamed protein product [Acanthoscelides obtectus]CAK1662393.1 Protein lifeguard 2 [Acanthoscelides obtectus]